MRGQQDTVMDCTSQVFEGMITLNTPQFDQQGSELKSWVARWQRLEGYQPGVYAVKVVGSLHDDYVLAAESAGVNYVPRDGSGATDEQ